QGKTETIKKTIYKDKLQKKNMRKAQDYYEYKHDIEDNKIYYFDEHENLVEDIYATNTRISHPFFTELVDQVVAYMLSNPVEIKVEDDEEFQESLKEYWKEDTQLFLQEMLEGSSIKSYEYAFARTNSQDKLMFQVSNALQTFDVVDHTGDRVATVRYYELPILRDDKREMVEHCEVWTDYNVTFYVKNDKDEWILNKNENPNPRSHVIATVQEDDDKEPVTLGRSYG